LKLSLQNVDIVGSPLAFIVAVAIVTTWPMTGPFDLSDTWQLVITIKDARKGLVQLENLLDDTIPTVAAGRSDAGDESDLA
jgi:low affinity Fe/Cu permease